MSEARILHFDCFAGLAGDMVVASLVDLGVPFAVVEEAVRALPVHGYEMRMERVFRGAVEANRFVVELTERQHHHRHFGDIREMIEGAGLGARVAGLAVRIFERIARAEARVHGKSVDEVHFHEVGAVDSIVDIVGAAAAIVHLDAKVSCRPVPVGRGMIETAHGQLPVPAPATLLVLEGVPLEGTDIEEELTTPTGAGIVREIAARFGNMPRLIPEAVGFGAGTRTREARPGLLRTVLGAAWDWGSLDARAGQASIIEANIDDMTGEVAAAAATALMEAGALDVWFEPIQMKKGRPAIKICVLTRQGEIGRLGEVLLTETTSIGLRHYDVGRIEMARERSTVETPWGPVSVKIARGPNGSANAAPEFEDCQRLAAEHGVPLKTVLATALGRAQDLL